MKLDQNVGDIGTIDFAQWILSISDDDLNCVESQTIEIQSYLNVWSNNHLRLKSKMLRIQIWDIDLIVQDTWERAILTSKNNVV